MRAICGFLDLTGAPAQPRQLDAVAKALVVGNGSHLTSFEGAHEGPVALGAARWSRQPSAAQSQLARHASTGCIDVREQTVANHIEGDVEVGCMVSGGLDSSTLAVIARDQLLAAARLCGAAKSGRVHQPTLPDPSAGLILDRAV